MRHCLLRLGCAVVSASFLLTSAASDGAGWKTLGWDGFGVGAFVLQKATRTSIGADVQPQPPVPIGGERRKTLVKVTPDAYVVKEEEKGKDGTWTGSEQSLSRKVGWTDPKYKDVGEEVVTVEGTAIPCRKLQFVGPQGTDTLWVHKAYHVVKSES